ncbi:outer membrane protein assembly factor BamA [Balneola sp. MJW-20]|uniref:outer membrane protein assembly factor BamA n=1 Tax=Gracilimonas aurantiaca TaxID=3234185 RepID=UPI0034658A77
MSIKRNSILIAFIIIGISLFSPTLYAQDTLQITDPTQLTPQEYTIQEVEIRGNEFTRDQFIINASSLSEGSSITYPGEDIQDALRRLFRSGLFSDVKIYIKSRTATTISLIIEVVEQPRIFEYKLEGIKRSQRRDLKELITLIPGVAVTESNTGQAINTIKRFYKNKGYWNTSVTTRTEQVADAAGNRVNLIFDIDAGQRLEVKDIVFNGNEKVSDRKLRKKMKPLKEDAWWKIFGKKVFKEEDFIEGKDNIIQLYRNDGFIDARITSDSVYTYNWKGDKTGIKVVVNIAEGPQYKVRNITWDGNTVYSDEVLTTTLGFEKGDIFNQEQFDTRTSFSIDGTDVPGLYQNIGYLFFQLFPEIQKVAEDSIDIHFEIFEDEIATIKEVSFSGNTRTHDDVVRRTLRTIPGTTYSRDAMVRTVRELSTLGFFDPQSIQPIPNANPQDKTVDIQYTLDESQSTSNFEFSGGYGGRGIGAIVSARINFNNFSAQRLFEKGAWTPVPTGDGQQLSLGVQVTGTGYQSYSFGFVEPWFRGKPTSLGVNLSYNLLNFRGSTERNELFSANLSIGKRLRWPDDYFREQTVIGYQLYNVQGNQSFLAEGTSSLFTVEQVIERNSLDNLISPNQGSKITLSGEVAIPFPGFSEYYKIKTSYQHHFPLVQKLVLTSTASYGYIGYFTKDKRSDLQRFLVGGTPLQQRQAFLYDNIDLRGYPGGLGNSIAPFVDGEQVGGRLYNKYSLELRYPAVSTEQLQLIPYLFLDAGNAFLDFDTFDPFNVKRSAGFGSRIYLPILGLVDLSYGYRFDGVRGTGVEAGAWEFLFNIGAPF